MIYGLTKEDLKRVDKNAVKKLIDDYRERLNLWSLPNNEKEKLRQEIKGLEDLLKEVS